MQSNNYMNKRKKDIFTSTQIDCRLFKVILEDKSLFPNVETKPDPIINK